MTDQRLALVDEDMKLSTSQKLGMTAVGGVVFVPIPADPSDAWYLYDRDPTFCAAIDALARRRGNREALLHSGPNCLEIEATRLGICDD